MKFGALVVAIGTLAFPHPSPAQVSFSGQTEVHIVKSADTESPRAVNEGRPTFGWRTDAFLNAGINDHVGALVDLRVTDNQQINFDYIVIRLTDLTSLGFNIQAGKFDLPFGNLSDRRFPRTNPLLGLPVIYDHATALPGHLTTEAEVLGNRGLARGLRLLDQGMYNLGMMVYGSAGILDYAFALTSGTISATSSYAHENFNSNLGKVFRIAITPMTGLTIGSAYNWGGYLDDAGYPQVRAEDVGKFDQQAAEADFEFSRGHGSISGEAVVSSWRVPLDTHDDTFKAFGFTVEGKYTVIPRLFVALRAGGLRFDKAVLEGVRQQWDFDITEWEGGAGYFLDRDVLVKLVRRESRIAGGSHPKDNLTALQLVVAY